MQAHILPLHAPIGPWCQKVKTCFLVVMLHIKLMGMELRAP